jgi:hypothetical protein
MDRKEAYKRKVVSVEEAVKVVKSRDRVVFGGFSDQPKILRQALYDRMEELTDAEVFLGGPSGDPGRFRPKAEHHIRTTLELYKKEVPVAILDTKLP